jgi:hypothetical protein
MSLDLSSVLGTSVHDTGVRRLIEFAEEAPTATERDADLGGRYYLEFPQTGFSVLVDGYDIVQTLHLHTTNREYSHPFPYDLPHGITSSTTRDDARRELGPPYQSGGPTKAFGSTPACYWDKWRFSRYSLHLEFPLDCRSVSLVTLEWLSSTHNEPNVI